MEEEPRAAQPLAPAAPADGMAGVDNAVIKRLVQEQVALRVAEALALIEESAIADKALKRRGAQHIDGVSAVQVAAVRRLIRDLVKKGVVKICSADHGQPAF